MRVGRLRERIELYCVQDGVDEWGQAIRELVKKYELWASMEAVQSDEKLAAAKMISQASTKFTIRYVKGVDESFVLKHNNIEYEIVGAVAPFGEKSNVLELFCIRLNRRDMEVHGGINI